MSRHVNHISDIPQTRKFDMDAGPGYSTSKTFTQYKKAWGTGAKRRTKQVGKRLKGNGLISNYRRASYSDVAVPIGEGRTSRRKVWVLYIRK